MNRNSEPWSEIEIETVLSSEHPSEDETIYNEIVVLSRQHNQPTVLRLCCSGSFDQTIEGLL